MRIITCGFQSVGSLLFSDAARRLVVINFGKPYLEVHSLHNSEPTVMMDKKPPRGRRVAGYSDAEERLRIVPVPGPSNSREILSADGTRALWVEMAPRVSTCRLHSFTFQGEEWHPNWTAAHRCTRHPNGNGGYFYPLRYFDSNRRFLFMWSDLDSKLGVGDATDGQQLTVSPFFNGTVELTCAATSAALVAVAVCAVGAVRPPVGRPDRLLIFPDGVMDGEPVERRHRGGFNALAADPFGRFLLSAAGNRVTVWDSTTWKPARTFDWKIGKVTCLAVSADGTVAAAGGDKGKVAVWDVE